jgi:two-component system cell cycle response regulator
MDVQGKILIIDGISTNRIVLKVKLTTAFYQVEQANSLKEALALIQAERPDLVITALQLPDGTAAQLCEHLHASADTTNLPVLAISAAPDANTRLHTLRAGAFDVMDKPVDETLLLGRVRNMLRTGHTIAEWQIRDETVGALGLAEAPAEFLANARISLIGMEAGALQGWARLMQPHMRAKYSVTLLSDAMAALHNGPPPDGIVLALPQDPVQSDTCMRLISALRASGQTREIALMVLQPSPDPTRATTILDFGADDLMTGPFDAPELGVRLKAVLRRKRHVAHMLQSVRSGLREVAIDPLTNLYNRRYAMPYMHKLVQHNGQSESQFAVIVADMDHFKRINDLYGHASGDAVLIETARRLRETVRGGDMVARMGGEEFLITLPSTDIATARNVASRLCHAIGSTPFHIPGAEQPVQVTITIGLATNAALNQSRPRTAIEDVETLLDHADKALYAAKTEGRNCVKFSTSLNRPAA